MKTSILSLIAFLLMSQAAWSFQQAPPSTEPNLNTLNDQIQIMRLVLANSLNKSLSHMFQQSQADKAADEDSESQQDEESTIGVAGTYSHSRSNYTMLLKQQFGYQYASSTQFTSYTRGFFVPGSGVVFTTALSVPVSEITANHEDNHQNEWELAKRELQGQASKNEDRRADSAWVIDPQYIDTAIDTALQSIFEFGLNIEGLRAEENIILAIRFEPSGYNWFVNDTGKDKKLHQIVTYSSRAGTARSQSVIIQVSGSELRQIHKTLHSLPDSVDMSEHLRSHAEIIKYGDPLTEPIPEDSSAD